MKTIIKNTLIICTLLGSGMVNTFVLGMEQETENFIPNLDESKNSCWFFTKKFWKESVLLLCCITGATFTGYELAPTCPPLIEKLTFNPPSFPYPEVECPVPLDLADEYNCSHPGYWPALRLAEAELSDNGYSDYCTPQENPLENNFKNPRIVVCENWKGGCKTLLNEMKNRSINYYEVGGTWFGSIGKGWHYYTYDAKDHTFPSPSLTKDEIEQSPNATETIKEDINFKSHTCNDFEIREKND